MQKFSTKYQHEVYFYQIDWTQGMCFALALLQFCDKNGAGAPRHRGTQLPRCVCVDDLSCVCAIVPHKILDLTTTLSQSKVSSSTYKKIHLMYS